MKTILGSAGHHYVANGCIFLAAVALISGMVGCGPTPVHYDLTITSTAGGSVTTPGEGTFTYDEATTVNLVVEVEEGYDFAKWTGDVGTIGDVNAIETMITMNGYYSITANFVPDGFEAIVDWYDLDAIRDDLRGNYILMNDLNSTTAGYEALASATANGGSGWQPIGTQAIQFRGIFEGQGYVIHDLFINRPDESYVGLFSWVGEEGIIESVNGQNLMVTGDEYVGGLVARNTGNVTNSSAAGNVTGNGWVGGLAGRNIGTVSNCHFCGSVIGGENVGGIVGHSTNNVNNCYSSGNVTGDQFLGGLVGFTNAAVSNSYSICSVAGGDSVGGLVGYVFEGTVTNSFSTGTVSGTSLVGGLVGWNNDGTVSYSYSTGGVAGLSSTGGLVGYMFTGTVANSFWDTETSGQSTSDGGTGKNTTEMQDIDTFTDTETEGLDEPWDMTTVDDPGTRNPSYIWNIVDDVTYPFLSWQP